MRRCRGIEVSVMFFVSVVDLSRDAGVERTGSVPNGQDNLIH